jgi:YD repeat-containing protein
MISQSLVAVVLPAGVGPGGSLRANIYLTPRLSGAQRLSDFPDWLHWTAHVRQHGLSFTLSCGSATTTVTADTTQLRPDVWDAIFGHDSLVNEYPASDFIQRLIVSYPSRDAADFVRYAYLRAATLADRELTGRTLTSVLSDLVFRGKDGRSNLDQVLSELRVSLWQQQHSVEFQSAGGGPPSAAASPAAHLAGTPPLTQPTGTRAMAAQFALYHRLPAAPTRRPLPSTPDELAKLIDFHQALAVLAAHPSLLAAIGLALPVKIPGSLCPASPSAGNYLAVQVTAVQPGWAWAQPPNIGAPATAYTRGAATFTAAPATSPATLASGGPDPGDIIDGFLALTPADFHLVGVDLDGALLKALALADSLANADDPALADGLLPALRSSGLSLLADNRAQQVLNAIQNNQELDAVLSGQQASPLTARDVTRGYRLDVFSDLTGAWHSLHRRDGTYRLGHGRVVLRTDDEEGFTQLAVVQPADDPRRPEDPVATAAGIPQPGTDLYVNERIARWNGWSLSAPRPGTPLNRSPDPSRALDTDPTMGESVTTFAMTSSFAAHPGSLPMLRFGARYRVRARAADLAGQSVALTASAPDSVIAPPDGQLLPYFRYEPVPHPILVLRNLPTAGGSLAQLVIRSYNSDPSLDTAAADDTDERHIAPPRAAVLLVEQHGMLDDPGGCLRGDATTYQMIVERDRGQIPAVGHDPLEPGPQLAVPYFPDPLARGAALTNLPQTAPNSDGTVTAGVLGYHAGSAVDPRPGSVTHVPFSGAWPDQAAFRIRLAEGQQPPTWDEQDRVLTVRLPKGQTTQTALSSYVHPGDLDLLGVWDWLRALFEQLESYELQFPEAGAQIVASTADRGLLTRLMLDGSNEFITPSLPVTLTHAVQQPLGLPTWIRLPIVHNPASPVDAAYLGNSFSPVTAWRSFGSHHAVLLGALQINGTTTAAVDLEARWIEWTDDVSKPGPTRAQISSQVERITLGSLDADTIPADGTDTRQVAVYVPQIDTLWFAAPFDQLDGVPAPS